MHRSDNLHFFTSNFGSSNSNDAYLNPLSNIESSSSNSLSSLSREIDQMMRSSELFASNLYNPTFAPSLPLPQLPPYVNSLTCSLISETPFQNSFIPTLSSTPSRVTSMEPFCSLPLLPSSTPRLISQTEKAIDLNFQSLPNDSTLNKPVRIRSGKRLNSEQIINIFNRIIAIIEKIGLLENGDIPWVTIADRYNQNLPDDKKLKPAYLQKGFGVRVKNYLKNSNVSKQLPHGLNKNTQRVKTVNKKGSHSLTSNSSNSSNSSCSPSSSSSLISSIEKVSGISENSDFFTSNYLSQSTYSPAFQPPPLIFPPYSITNTLSSLAPPVSPLSSFQNTSILSLSPIPSSQIPPLGSFFPTPSQEPSLSSLSPTPPSQYPSIPSLRLLPSFKNPPTSPENSFEPRSIIPSPLFRSSSSLSSTTQSFSSTIGPTSFPLEDQSQKRKIDTIVDFSKIEDPSLASEDFARPRKKTHRGSTEDLQKSNENLCIKVQLVAKKFKKNNKKIPWRDIEAECNRQALPNSESYIDKNLKYSLRDHRNCILGSYNNENPKCIFTKAYKTRNKQNSTLSLEERQKNIENLCNKVQSIAKKLRKSKKMIPWRAIANEYNSQSLSDSEIHSYTYLSSALANHKECILRSYDYENEKTECIFFKLLKIKKTITPEKLCCEIEKLGKDFVEGSGAHIIPWTQLAKAYSEESGQTITGPDLYDKLKDERYKNRIKKCLKKRTELSLKTTQPDSIREELSIHQLRKKEVMELFYKVISILEKIGLNSQGNIPWKTIKHIYNLTATDKLRCEDIRQKVQNLVKEYLKTTNIPRNLSITSNSITSSNIEMSIDLIEEKIKEIAKGMLLTKEGDIPWSDIVIIFRKEAGLSDKFSALDLKQKLRYRTKNIRQCFKNIDDFPKASPEELIKICDIIQGLEGEHVRIPWILVFDKYNKTLPSTEKYPSLKIFQQKFKYESAIIKQYLKTPHKESEEPKPTQESELNPIEDLFNLIPLSPNSSTVSSSSSSSTSSSSLLLPVSTVDSFFSNF